jgi:hypothetical protein
MKKFIFASSLLLCSTAFCMNNAEIAKKACTDAYSHREIEKEKFQKLCNSTVQAELNNNVELDEAFQVSCETMAATSLSSAYFCYSEASKALKDVYPYKIVNENCSINYEKSANTHRLIDGYGCFSRNFDYVLQHENQ